MNFQCLCFGSAGTVTRKTEIQVLPLWFPSFGLGNESLVIGWRCAGDSITDVKFETKANLDWWMVGCEMPVDWLGCRSHGAATNGAVNTKRGEPYMVFYASTLFRCRGSSDSRRIGNGIGEKARGRGERAECNVGWDEMGRVVFSREDRKDSLALTLSGIFCPLITRKQGIFCPFT